MHSTSRWLPLFLFTLGISQTSIAEVPGTRIFEVQVVNEDANCSAALHFRVEGLISGCWNSHDLYTCQMKAAGRHFLIDLDKAGEPHDLIISDASQLQLLLTCPGYRIMTQELAVGEFEAQGSWDVELLPLPRRSIRGRATVGADQPIRNGIFEVRYTLKEAMPYFGYVDGAVPEIRLGSFETDEAGEFETELPDLQQDPWIDSNRGYWVHIVPVAEQAGGWNEKVEGLRWSLQELTAPLELRFKAIRPIETPR